MEAAQKRPTGIVRVIYVAGFTTPLWATLLSAILGQVVFGLPLLVIALAGLGCSIVVSLVEPQGFKRKAAWFCGAIIGGLFSYLGAGLVALTSMGTFYH